MNGQDEPITSNVTEAPAAPAVEIFKCKKCGREFGKAQALQTHVTRAHTKFWSTNKKPEPEGLGKRGPGKTSKHKRGAKVCPVCNKRFAKFYLTQHMRTQHGQSLKEYRNGQTVPDPSGPARMGRPRERVKTCPVCKKEFATRPGMTLHLRKVHGKSITQYQGRGGRRLLEPEQAEPRVISTPQATHEERNVRQKKEGREVIFCPVCGTNIHAVRTAVNFADQ